MVQILVKVKDDLNNTREWLVLEIQGDIVCNCPQSAGRRHFGHLIFSERPILIVGHHMYNGKTLILNSGISVLKKEHSNGYSSTANRAGNNGYLHLGIIEKKIIFRTRPRPLVSKKH
ncbi:chromosome transmission fidelity protein 8 homolog [Stegodyphus dumicola]|uniref:chromosome transmission fidelity protein 8 homolog n=1 Tax=Stegodyphus dumicola TaxID=202533 RepID=UPI0015AE9865|nr:chromosome transmission fidelity protein 8 homolog [Stegodyphus dumicola]